MASKHFDHYFSISCLKVVNVTTLYTMLSHDLSLIFTTQNFGSKIKQLGALS